MTRENIMGAEQEQRLLAEIREGASARGACGLERGMGSWEDAAAVLMSPQGREFCLKRGWPDMALWRAIKSSAGSARLERLGVWVDSGDIDLENPGRAALIGATRARIGCRGAEELQRIMLAHGASAAVAAERWAVVQIERDGVSRAEIAADRTARVSDLGVRRGK